MLAAPAILQDLAAVSVGPDSVDIVSKVTHLRATFPARGVARVELTPANAPAGEGSFAVERSAPLPLTAVGEAGEEVSATAGGLVLKVNQRTLAFTLSGAEGGTVWESQEPVVWNAGGAGERSRSRWPLSRRPMGSATRPGDFLGVARPSICGTTTPSGGGRTPTALEVESRFSSSCPRVGLGGSSSTTRRVPTPTWGRRSDRLSDEVERGGFDVYLFSGPDRRTILSAYTGLTGRQPLPPRWALGYHQSRYSYGSEAEVRALFARFRKERFPLDAIWLDIDFQEHRAPFRVDRRRFPHFERMVADLSEGGVRTVVITDPHLWAASGKEPYASGLKGDHLILAPSDWPPDGGLPKAGSPPFLAEVWPGTSAFPELTLARTRAWFGGLYRAYVEAGVAGFWDDMNEPAIFNVLKSMPEGVRHRLDGGGSADHVAIHNAYGLLQAKATYEGVLALRPGARPFVLTRAAYAGSQRFAATWTGDNRADREGLSLTIPTLLNLGVSGFSFAGADVGGHEGCPDPELLTSWMELGALMPFFRNHSNQGTCRREPWVNGEAELARRREAVLRRYRMLPFLYTLFEEASRTGLPVMRPLWLEHPEDPATWKAERSFLLGRDLLVAPRLSEGTKPYEVVLPRGSWFDPDSGELLAGGPVTASPPGGGSVKLYVRAGAILPEGPPPSGAEETPQGALRLEIWPASDCGGGALPGCGRWIRVPDR